MRLRLLQQQRLRIAKRQVVRFRKCPHNRNISLGSFCRPYALMPAVPVSFALEPHGKRWRCNQNHFRATFDDQRMLDYRCKVVAKVGECDLSIFMGIARFAFVGRSRII